MEGLASLLSALSVMEVSLEGPNRAIKVWSLREPPQLQENSIAMAKTCVRI